MTKTAATLLVAGLAIAACSPTDRDSGAGPIATFETTTFDAGKVKQGHIVNYEFTVTNAGDQDLIMDAKANCGCTVAEVDRVVRPGGKAKVSATLDTARFKGETAKTVTVSTNDPAHPHVSLELKADVLLAIEAKPNQVLISARSGEKKTTEISLVSNDGTAFRVSGASEAGCLKAVWTEPAPEATASVVRIETREDCPGGRSWHEIAFTTTHPDAGTVPIKVILDVKSDASVSPQSVVLRPTREGERPGAAKWAAATVKIAKPDGPPINVAGVTSSDPLVATDLKTVTPGREYGLEIRYTGQPAEQQRNAEVTITLDAPRGETIVIPVLIL